VRWFKHLSGSLNDSLIFEAVEKFGGDGYLVYFGILEMLADDLDILNPGVCEFSFKKVRKNLQLSRQKTVKILKFFDQKAKKNKQKTVGFYVDIQKDYITVNCPKFKKYCDEYTRKGMSGVCQE
jgi:hypothetical protein